MHGDFSRTTFDGVDSYRAVLMQQGRVLLDADWNEQGDITAHHDEARTADVVGHSGGPAAGPGTSGVAAVGPFAIVANDGGQPAATLWRDLRVTPGTYYVDGVLCESAPFGVAGGAPAASGWPLIDQPHLRAIGDVPGLPEPSGAVEGDRYAVYLDVWTHHVTADEDPALLESALGGPDTTTRARTIWQVRSLKLGDAVACSDLHAGAVAARTPRRMVALLQPPGSNVDPCQITGSGGYERLENQLYRVEVHQGPVDSSAGTILWSRNNGSVVAGLTKIEVLDGSTTAATLTTDRQGRDDELSFGQGQLVEITSTDLQLRGDRGFLGRTGVPTVVSDGAGVSSAVTLPVTWQEPDHRPQSLAALGRFPIVRGWDGGPLGVQVTANDLEGGIAVRFPNAGEVRTGDYWLIPARTVRLAYGLSQQSGTIEWPPGNRGPAEQPPAGPIHQLAPLAILRRRGAGWSLDSDCRRLFPRLTGLVTIDLIGGDGQEAMPGDRLPEPIRVAVRNGGLPVAGARLAVDSGSGRIWPKEPPETPPGPFPSKLPSAPGAADAITTGADGVAKIWWQLDVARKVPTTQTLTIRRLDDHDQPIDVPVVATGRLSLARQVAWNPPDACDGFGGTRTVQDALEQLVRTPMLRLIGGDGQQVRRPRSTVPQPVRVVVDNPCGWLEHAEVVAAAGDSATGFGLVLPAVDGQPTPATLDGTGAGRTAGTTTGADGIASFWWQPEFGNQNSATLDIVLEGPNFASVRVAAQLDPPGTRTPGVHIVGLRVGDQPFLNDAQIKPDELAKGIVVDLDGPVVPASVKRKPVVRVVLDLPWPTIGEGGDWAAGPVGYRSVELAADWTSEGSSIIWMPTKPTETWIMQRLWDILLKNEWGQPILGRFIVDGWGIVAENDPALHLNGHADAVLLGGRTHLLVPTDDEVTGGQFLQWFYLTRDPVIQLVDVADVSGRTEAVAVRTLETQGLVVKVVTEPSLNLRKGLVVRTEPAGGVEVEVGTVVTVVVSQGRGL